MLWPGLVTIRSKRQKYHFFFVFGVWVIHMELRQLEYFVAAAELLSFSAAAERCCVVQSTISHQIANLEEELGVRLFERGGRAIGLTPVGEEGPYYLLLAMPRAYTSGGGLYVNDKLQVLSAEDETTPMAGLFAAGTDCLGATAPFYYGGEYLSWAFVSARGAGRSAARYAAGLDLEYELETIEVGGLMVTGGDSSSADDPDTPMGFLRDENEA